jgi:diphosphomevalonate decarboxylase
MAQMLNALGRGDIEQVGSIMELEAMEMHAVMMTAQPPARYWVPETSQLIAWIRSERLKGKMPAWFTIDAGPNVHLLCAASDAPAVRSHLATFQPHSPSQSHTSLAILPDFTGSGPLLTVE